MGRKLIGRSILILKTDWITNMVTLKIEGKDNLIACDINDLEAVLNDEMQKVILYLKGDWLGPVTEVIGMSEEEFISKIRMRY